MPSSNLQVEVMKARMDGVPVHHPPFALEPFRDSYRVTFPIFLVSLNARFILLEPDCSPDLLFGAVLLLQLGSLNLTGFSELKTARYPM